MNKFLLSCALAFFAWGNAGAGTEPLLQPVATRETNPNFARGALEFQNVMGAYFFFDTGKNNRPAIDYAVDSLRLGVMLSNPHGPSFLTGNFELLGEIFAGGIFDGPGNVAAGATLCLRYNFIQPRAHLLPYLQIGAGGIYTDIPEKESLGLISLPVEFNLQAVVGTRLMLNERWSIVLETNYRHVSNAEIKKPNFGLDSIGGNVGFGFFF